MSESDTIKLIKIAQAKYNKTSDRLAVVLEFARLMVRYQAGKRVRE